MRITPEEAALFERERGDYDALLAAIADHPRAALSSGLQITGIGNTGGASNVVNGRPCGGFLLRHGGRTVIVDPGDNSLSSLVRRGFDPFEITDVFASHAHNDHVGDLSLAVSAAINLGLSGRTDSRIVVAPTLVDYGNAGATRLGFTVPAFGWKADVVSLFFEARTTTRHDGRAIRSVPEAEITPDLRVRATEARHGGTDVTGVVFETGQGRIGYTSDTEYFEGLPDAFAGVDMLWMNMNTLSLGAMQPDAQDPGREAEPTHNHLGYVGVCRMIERVRPRIAVVSHFGAQVRAQRAAVEAALQQRFSGLGVEVCCARNWDCWAFDGALRDGPVRRTLLQ